VLAARFQLKTSKSPDIWSHKDFNPLNISFRVIQGRGSQQIKTRLILPFQEKGMEILNEVISREIHSCLTFNINITRYLQSMNPGIKIHRVPKL